MSDAPSAPQAAPRPKPALVLLAVTLALVLVWLGSLSTFPFVSADPLATATPTPIRPDCRLGYTLRIGDSIGSIPPEATMQTFRGGVYYDYRWHVTLTPPGGGTPFDWDIPDLSPTREVYGMQHILLVRVHGAMVEPGAYWWNAPYRLPTPGSGTRAWEFHYEFDTSYPAATSLAITQEVVTATIANTAREAPGMLWLIGNEIDHADNTWPPDALTAIAPTQTVEAEANNQDGIVPESYAEAYHDLYYLIKSNDPTALIAPGSVTEWTQYREEYWNRVLRAYDAMYHEPMPVDFWNVHAYNRYQDYWYPGCGLPQPTPISGPTLTPVCIGYNSSIPPGFTGPGTPAGPTTPTAMPTSAATRAYYVNMLLDAPRLEQQLIDMRGWLKEHGYQGKPLIVSEFALPLIDKPTPDPGIREEEAETFFFEQVMPWLENYTDPEIGYPYDGYHLVQRWIVFNNHQYTDPDSKFAGFPFFEKIGGVWHITTFGLAWADYVAAPENGYFGWPCQIGEAQAVGPAIYLPYVPPMGALGGPPAYPPPETATSSSGGVAATPTPTASLSPTPQMPYP